MVSDAGRGKTLGVPVVIGGDNLPNPVEIGLTDLPNIGRPVAPLAPPVPASLRTYVSKYRMEMKVIAKVIVPGLR